MSLCSPCGYKRLPKEWMQKKIKELVFHVECSDGIERKTYDVVYEKLTTLKSRMLQLTMFRNKGHMMVTHLSISKAIFSNGCCLSRCVLGECSNTSCMLMLNACRLQLCLGC